MKDKWYIADTHFGHKNIMAYEPEHRGHFKTIEEHDETLIERWNSVIKPKDDVYHLGDFCFGRKQIAIITQRLNGKIRLILGNHDLYTIEDYVSHFYKIYGIRPDKGFILTHVPLHPAHTRWELNVHGHLHSKRVQCQPPSCKVTIDDPQYLCVSAEQNNLTPIHRDVIEERLKLIRS